MRFVILGAIILFVVVAGLAVLKLYGQPSTPAVVASTGNAPEVQTVDVLVARSDIPLGTVLNASMLDKQPWPKQLVVNGFVVSGTPEGNVEGMVTRSDFHAREPLVLGRLAKPNEAGFVASELPKGMRAVTVSTDAITGVAGYVFPGDRVDVMFAHSVPQDAPEQLIGLRRAGGNSSQKPTTAEVLLPNLRVLAVNVRKAGEHSGQTAQQTAHEPVAETPTNITLEMTQEDNKKLRLAEKNGALSLALRSLQDADDSSVGLPITLLNISRAEGSPSAEALRALKWVLPDRNAVRGGAEEVIIIRGVKTEEGMRPADADNMPGEGAAPPSAAGGAR